PPTRPIPPPTGFPLCTWPRPWITNSTWRPAPTPTASPYPTVGGWELRPGPPGGCGPLGTRPPSSGSVATASPVTTWCGGPRRNHSPFVPTVPPTAPGSPSPTTTPRSPTPAQTTPIPPTGGWGSTAPPGACARNPSAPHSVRTGPPPTAPCAAPCPARSSTYPSRSGNTSPQEPPWRWTRP